MIKIMISGDTAEAIKNVITNLAELVGANVSVGAESALPPVVAPNPPTEMLTPEAAAHPTKKKPKKPGRPKKVAEPTSTAESLSLVGDTPAESVSRDDGGGNESEFSLDDIRMQMQILMTKKGLPAVEKLMKDFEVQTVKNLLPAQYTGVMKAIAEDLAS